MLLVLVLVLPSYLPNQMQTIAKRKARTNHANKSTGSKNMFHLSVAVAAFNNHWTQRRVGTRVTGSSFDS